MIGKTNDQVKKAVDSHIKALHQVVGVEVRGSANFSEEEQQLILKLSCGKQNAELKIPMADMTLSTIDKKVAELFDLLRNNLMRAGARCSEEEKKDEDL